ncbi:CHRD domain-containing protein [Nitrosospira multiformis ATCC 25196]|uniref:CHRD domain-containing protein n=1 Tax=Nitrosospira multiformis (strain ATCC 25196 / NCIMB 11849 / C 71) TaxID=323848 RepID=Q2Y8A7_NITMU|nr:CHRD domain-containing protein [Nitrosospira multiformis]ABB75014.1 CHRD protein [Nitrosospira multiformis ATCC 25196]SEF84586.1 CHRD domain-containing protein [Nitrosospira multiformis ATCC 25196]
MNKVRKTPFAPPAWTVALLAVLALSGTTANATDITVHLTGDQEVPPVKTSAMGHGTLTVEDDKSIKGKVMTSDIKGTGAHVHEAQVGKNGPDIITLNKTSDNEWSIPDGAKLTDAQYDAFKAGGLYINVHSDTHKNGEIRGQLKR